jgi:hypothetical protein
MLRLARTADVVRDHFGDPPATLFLDPHESPAAYWTAKMEELPADAKQIGLKIAEVLLRLEDPRIGASERVEMLDQLRENMGALNQGRRNYLDTRLVEVASVLLAEAVRGPLEGLRTPRANPGPRDPQMPPLPSRPISDGERREIQRSIDERKKDPRRRPAGAGGGH